MKKSVVISIVCRLIQYTALHLALIGNSQDQTAVRIDHKIETEASASTPRELSVKGSSSWLRAVLMSNAARVDTLERSRIPQQSRSASSSSIDIPSLTHAESLC